jgi:UDP-glucose 4-epimerase
MKILVTGGAGYIGSHACVELLAADYEVVVVDNLCNSSAESLARVEAITGKPLTFIEADIGDRAAMAALFAAHEFAAVIHFAGLKAVGESVTEPQAYYQNNVAGSLVLFEEMQAAGVKTIIFSSSATVYGDPHEVPINEQSPLQATNPYGRTKEFIESILRDSYVADPSWRIGLLRYFNPVGAHESGRIGEDPEGKPNNLMPYISQVAVGKLPQLSIFGDDYPTVDGTGVRDYIHVVDLVKGHLAALKVLLAETSGELITVNLGTGNGYSVKQVVAAFEQASGRSVPVAMAPRRPGDIAACWADVNYASERLGWKACYGIERMCADTWRWQNQNPNGYKS